MSLQTLQLQLEQKRINVNKRYLFYEMKNVAKDFGISTPPSLKYMQEILGWCAKAVDSLSDRLQLREFTDDVFDLNTIYSMNNADILYGSAILGALIGGCSFIYVSEDESGFPRLQVIDGANATGKMDPITNLLEEGYAVLERDELGIAKKTAYFTPDYTAYYDNGNLVDVRENVSSWALLVPVVFRPDAKRMFGHSRISRACMSIMTGALRTVKRSEISAEFYSFPQRWVTGIDDNVEHFDKWQATMSSMLKFTLNDDGDDHIKLGQFTQQSMEPHIAQLRMFAALFAGETGLTMDDLGFVTENPSSEGAIIAAHENLRLTATKAQRTFATGFINAGYLAACVRDRFPYERRQLRFTKARWYPIFTPDVSMLGAVGDALGKLSEYNDIITSERIEDITGW